MFVHDSRRPFLILVALQKQAHQIFVFFIFVIGLERLLHTCLAHLFIAASLLIQFTRVHLLEQLELGQLREHPFQKLQIFCNLLLVTFRNMFTLFFLDPGEVEKFRDA